MKIGDRVRVVAVDHRHRGAEGVIVAQQDYSEWVEVGVEVLREPAWIIEAEQGRNVEAFDADLELVEASA